MKEGFRRGAWAEFLADNDDKDPSDSHGRLLRRNWKPNVADGGDGDVGVAASDNGAADPPLTASFPSYQKAEKQP